MTLSKSRLLDGVRIVDFSWLAAGPTATYLLALEGAEVIRVESRRALDTYRTALTRDGDPNLSTLFAVVNFGKRSVTIDLKSESARKAVMKLVSTADVVVENFSSGTMERLGYGYSVLREACPDLVMVSCSATGQVGAMVRNAGYAPIFAALGGLAALTTTVGGLPALYGRQFDARVGVFGALAVVSGLVRRAKTGEGGYFDVSGQEVAATMACEATTGVLSGRSRHRAPGKYGHVHRSGDGRWLLAEPIDEEGADHRDPHSHGAEVDASTTMTVPVGKLSAEAALVALEAAGHRVTVVPTIEELTEDSELKGYDTFGTVEQPGLGSLMALGLPIQWSEELLTCRIGPAPAVGGDTRDVLMEVCGFSDFEVARLDQEGALE
jgi:crotonobetainyl-CoA:carnitine CoA-transferase CaiB-like acyl-CoA transferase